MRAPGAKEGFGNRAAVENKIRSLSDHKVFDPAFFEISGVVSREP
jgi:hypothetical protein